MDPLRVHPATYEIAMQTMAIIPYVMRVMAAAIRASEHAAAYSHVAVLGMLTARPYTLSELAERNSVSAPTMSSTVNTLEERGWVQRQRDQADRRVVWIAITPDGLRAVDEINRQVAQRIAHLLTSLDHEQQQSVVSGLKALREAFAAGLEADPDLHGH
jgi:DNA-binding MarR family transcriptional regulator